MKKSILIFAFAMFLNLGLLFAQNFQMMPAQPQAGETFTINYDPIGTDLEGVDVFAVAYVLELGESPKAYDIAMAKSDDGYTASFQTPANAQAVVVKFENESGEMVDMNNGNGYHTKMYKNGKPVKNAHAVSSSIYGQSADLFGAKADGAKAAESLALEMTNPTDRFSMEYLSYYASAVTLNKDEEGIAKITEHLNSMAAQQKLSEKELSKLADVARSLEDRDLYNTFNDKMKTEFPEGNMAISEKYADFRSLETLEEKLAMHKEAKSMYGANKDQTRMIERMAGSIARAYGKEGDFENMDKYVEQISSKSSRASIYNNIAWGCTGESLEGEGHDLQEGEKMSKKSLNLIEEEMNKQEGKMDSYSARQWKNNMQYSFGMYSDTYAMLAYKTGDIKSAHKYQKIACETSEMSDPSMNSRYAIFMEKDKGAKETMVYIEDMISEGNANAEMKQQFSRLYKANVSLDQAFDMYLARLEETAKALKIKEVKEEMVNEKSPSFALKNLKGEQISLESLKGKVVVVDFWATWCGPCKVSFPGMQKAVTKYDKADDVAFVFIDTWENAPNKEENAQKFIDGKGYTFNVLMDNENKMVEDFGVNGIPAKFILDKEGNIRFKSTGFNGNNDSLVDEISIVVELLRGNDGSNSRKDGVHP